MKKDDEEMTPEEKKAELDRTRVLLSKWEEMRRNQLAFTNNLVLTLAVGLIGFTANYLKERSGGDNAELALFFLVGSIFFAISAALTRLYDYRFTTNVVRLRLEELKNDCTKHSTEKKDLRQENSRLGKWTWRLLWWQVVAFVFGCFFIGLVLSK